MLNENTNEYIAENQPESEANADNRTPLQTDMFVSGREPEDYYDDNAIEDANDLQRQTDTRQSQFAEAISFLREYQQNGDVDNTETAADIEDSVSEETVSTAVESIETVVSPTEENPPSRREVEKLSEYDMAKNQLISRYTSAEIARSAFIGYSAANVICRFQEMSGIAVTGSFDEDTVKKVFE